MTSDNTPENQQRLIELLRQEKMSKVELLKAQKDLNAALKEQSREQRYIEAEMQKLALAMKAGTGDTVAARDEYNRLSDSLNKLKDDTENITEALTETGKKLEEISARMKGLGSVINSLVGDFSKLDTSLSGIVTLFIDQAHALDSVSVGLATSTGYASAMHDNMVALADSSNGLNLSFAEGGKIVSALSLGYKDFNMLNEDTQRSLGETVGRLYRLGVDGAAAAQSMDLLENGLGLTRIAAQGAVAEFENLAMATGQPVSQLVTDFNNLAPALSRFGGAGKEVFAELAKDARRLGITVQDAFNVTELFDTFEGAADVAGKLNSQLGMQLNSVEIMGTSSEERLKILRAEFNLRGQTFDSMGKRQKQMVAEILKTDVNMAARLFGDPMELRASQRDQLEQQERLAKFTSAADKLKQAFEQMFVKVEPILTGFTTGLGWLAEKLGSVIGVGEVLALVFYKIAKALASTASGAAKMTTWVSKFAPLLKGLGGILSVVTGLFDYWATGDPIYALMGTIGSIGGMAAGAALGSMILPGPGTIIGGMIGSLVGSTVLKGVTGGPDPEKKPKEFGDMVQREGQAPYAISSYDDLIALDPRKAGNRGALGGGQNGGQQPVQVTSNTNLYLDKRLIQEISSRQGAQDASTTRTKTIQSSPAALGYA